jgi:hypothetical protein
LGLTLLPSFFVPQLFFIAADLPVDCVERDFAETAWRLGEKQLASGDMSLPQCNQDLL